MGFKNENAISGSNDVVISYGLDFGHFPREHFLRFINTSFNIEHETEDEIEVARFSNGLYGFSYGGGSTEGNFGIGNFYNSSTIDGTCVPARRLEVFDNRNQAQMRLTYTRNTNHALGIHTDFQTTSAGHLLVNPIDGTVSRNVGINMTTAPVAKLDVNNNNMPVGIYGHTTTSPSWVNVGVRGTSQGAVVVSNIGVSGQAPDAITFNGIPQVVFAGLTFTTRPFNAGVVGQAQGSIFNFGGIFEANSCATNCLNYGIYASSRFNNFGTQPCGAGMAGFFQGSALATGDFFPNVSDGNLKDSIQNISNALTIVSRLLPKQFVFKTDSLPYMNLAEGIHYGFIAQEVDTVLPELVGELMQPAITDTGGIVLMDTFSFKAVKYTELIPLTISAIQELTTSKVSACSDPTVADSNQLVKWSGSEKVLCNSLIYDDGERVGIPSTEPYAYVNVSNHEQKIAASFTSDADSATGVLAALYDEDGGGEGITAIAGYSKYVNNNDADDGTGGYFVGGLRGVDARADGNNEMEFGVIGQSKNASFANVGVGGAATSPTDSLNAGVLATADSSAYASVALIATSEGITATALNAGVIAFAAGSSEKNVAGHFEANDTIGINYGVYGQAQTTTGSYAGYFNGNVHATGSVTWSSDGRLKNNIQDIDSASALESLLRLQPKTYQYRAEDFPAFSLPRGMQYGLLAEEVEQVFPALVTDVIQPEKLDKYGRKLSPREEYKGLNYVGLIPVLISALKEEHAKNEEMENRLEELEARMNTCCQRGAAKTDEDGGSGNSNGDNTNRMTVELSSMQVIVLEQNVPNPFAEQTSISYFIPDDVRSAQIIFSDMLGRNIKTVEVTTGYGIMTVFASNLSSGQYTYSLLIDGKVAETKKMSKGK